MLGDVLVRLVGIPLEIPMRNCRHRSRLGAVPDTGERASQAAPPSLAARVRVSRDGATAAPRSAPYVDFMLLARHGACASEATPGHAPRARRTPCSNSLTQRPPPA